jgi:EAL domain-containing protein (putative c-di-GMP-specific phosphodiesterase class I)
MEALIRWEDKETGLVSPKDFIPLAEETGMIVDIGNWVISSACRQGKIWHEKDFKDLILGVNLSVRQFFDPHLIDTIKSAIDNTQFNPTCLELEITETAMMHDTNKAMAIMYELKTMGIRICLDDFGTGYSSLVHLKLFHVDTLKIDQVFIRNADLQGRDGTIISSIIDMCHKLQIKVIAEGVETLEGLNFLKDKNCHSAQGFIFSPPLPVEKFEGLLHYSKTALKSP